MERIIVSAQVPVQLRDTLLRQALKADRTLSAEIRRALTRHADAECEPDEEES